MTPDREARTNERTRERQRPRPGARRPSLGGAPRTGADLRDGDRRRALRRPAPRHQRGRPGDLGHPQPGRARRAGHDRSRGTRPHPPHDDGRARGDRDAGARVRRPADRPALRRQPLRRTRRAHRRHRLHPADRHARASGSLRGAPPGVPRATWRPVPRSRGRGSRPAWCRRAPWSSAPSRRRSGSWRPRPRTRRRWPPSRRTTPRRASGSPRCGPTSSRPRSAATSTCSATTSPTPRRATPSTDLPGGDAIYAAEIRSWTTLPLDPQEVHDLGNERWEAIQTERFEIAGRLGYVGSGRGDRGPHRIRGRHARERGGAARARRGPGAAELGHRCRMVRQAPEGQLPRPRDRGVPGGGHGARVLHAADRGRRAARHLLHQHARPSRQGAAPDRVRHVSRGEPGPSLPDRPRDGVRAIARRCAGSADSSPARRSPRAGGSTASGSPTTWVSTSTTGNAWGCWRRRPIARRA